MLSSRMRFIVLAGIAACAAVAWLPHGDAAIVDNGVVQMGVTDLGNLVAPGGAPSTGGATSVGLRLDATNSDGIAGGCGCEGWGIAHDGLTGYVKGAAATGISQVSFEATATTATSVVDATQLRITHATAPSSSTFAFQTDVGIENKGPTLASSVIYRRVVDWGNEAYAGQEYVTLRGVSPAPTLLAFSSDDGLASANPLAGPTQISMTGPPAGPGADHAGPADHGALFDLGLGCLGPGDSLHFQMFYGAAPTESAALSALSQLGAQAWSLSESDPSQGAPQTFFLGFAGIDGLACLTPVFTQVFSETAPADLTLDPVLFTDMSAIPSLPGLEQHAAWSFGDEAVSTDAAPSHAYAVAGTYAACLHREARLAASAWRTWSTCHPIAVADRPPTAAWSSLADNVGVQFTDASTDLDGAVTTHLWSFGDTVTSTEASPSHTYALGGTYTVCLTAGDAFAATDKLCKQVPAPGTPNHPPFLVAVRSRHVTAGSLVQVYLQAFDPDLDPLTFSATGLPVGAKFDAKTGYFQWYPTPEQAGFYDQTDFVVADGRGGEAHRHLIVLVGLVATDTDLDGVADVADNCATTFNPAQADSDGDGTGDACDLDTAFVPDVEDIYLSPMERGVPDAPTACQAENPMDRDGDGVPDTCDPDIDGDGVANWGPPGSFLDNCPFAPNTDQLDSDQDGIGDRCALPVAKTDAPGGYDGAASGQSGLHDAAREPSQMAQPVHAGDARPADWSWVLYPFAGVGLVAGAAIGIAKTRPKKPARRKR
ncbi:MAG: PKD domain-containing protein [bacterium]